jgi:branched-chain amino acid transport system ATP-binding protein
VEDLYTQYGEIKVLHGVNITVQKGQFVSIVGANGAGKSTLINTISGLLKPTSGKILWQNNSDITYLPAHKRSRLGIIQVPEGRKLFPLMTVYENLLVASINQKKRRQDNIDFVYQIFPKLLERRNQVARTLSGGEQQMLAIARGIMSCPEILMLDEPSLGLSPILVQEIFLAVRQLNKEGLTTLLVEQNVNISLKLSHYAYVLENGCIVLEGSGEELLENEHTKKAYLGV